MIIAFHHASLIVEDLDRALDFYCNLLGLAIDPLRPDLGYPGAWLTVGSQQIHLLNLPKTEQTLNRPEHVGRDRHLAFHVAEIDGLKKSLELKGIPFTMSRSGREALFCRDPDGNGLEFILKK